MNPVTGLSLGRIAVGLASLARPDRVTAAMLPAPTAPAPTPTSLPTQWFGSRDAALGVLTLLATGSARRNLVLVGMAVDTADAATAYLAVRDGRLPPRLGHALTAVAATAVLSGLAGLVSRD